MRAVAGALGGLSTRDRHVGDGGRHPMRGEVDFVGEYEAALAAEDATAGDVERKSRTSRTMSRATVRCVYVCV